MSTVSYCDLCNVPLKDLDYYMLYISKAKASETAEQSQEEVQKLYGASYNSYAYYDYVKNIEKGVKDICPQCKEILDRLFAIRMERIGELADEIMLTFQQEAKVPPHEKKKRGKNAK